MLLLLACSGPADDTAGNATIAIVSPTDEATVCGAPLVVVTDVENFTLVAPFGDTGTEPEPGTGHIDVALNGQESTDWMFGGETLTLPKVEDGYYQLRVELSNADHTPIDPYAGDLIYITVDATVCE
jgi:hypothetical protein